MMEQYIALIRAMKILREAGRQLFADAGGDIDPAYEMIMHARSYLEEQARVALRGE